MTDGTPSDEAPALQRVSRIMATQLLAIGVIAFLGLVLWLARDELAPYLLGMLLVYMILPIVHRIEHFLPDHGRWLAIRRPFAAISAFVLALGAILVLLGFLLDPVIEQTSELFEQLPTYWQSIQEDNETFNDWYESAVPQQLQVWIDSNLQRIGKALVDGTAHLISWILGTSSDLVSSAMALIAVPLFVVYYLIQEPTTAATLRRQLPRSWSEDAIALIRILDRIMGSYTRGVILEASIVGLITGTGYWLIGVDLALPLGVVAFAGEIVPILGPWIAFVISFPVVLATQPDKAIPAIALFGVIQLLEGWFLAPRIEGKSVEFTSAGTLILLAVGAGLAGPIGIVFALPAAAVLRAIVVYVYNRLNGLTPEAALSCLPIFQKDASIASDSSPPIPVQP